MRTIITNMNYLTNADVSGVDTLEKTDKLIILYEKGMSVPISAAIALTEIKNKPSFMEIPSTEDKVSTELLFFRLGTMLSSLSGTVIFIDDNDTIKHLEDFTLDNVNIKVCQSFKAALKIADKQGNGTTRKTRQPRASKNATSLPSGDDDEAVAKLVYKFNTYLSNKLGNLLDINEYNAKILTSVRDASDPIGLSAILVLAFGRETGNLIFESIKDDFRMLKDIAMNLPL